MIENIEKQLNNEFEKEFLNLLFLDDKKMYEIKEDLLRFINNKIDKIQLKIQTNKIINPNDEVVNDIIKLENDTKSYFIQEFRKKIENLGDEVL